MQDAFSTIFPLQRGRVHDASGPGAPFFAAALAGMTGGTVLWIKPAWFAEEINPVAFSAFFDPRDIILARTADQTETLAAAEEGLRSGAVGLVVMEVDKPVELTPGRRLQLAAESGRSIGLSLHPEGAGNQAATTRWLCKPLFSASDSTLQEWSIIKNKAGTNNSWAVRWDETARRIHMVSETAERAGSKGPPG
ncbi:ImuA family protein [Martelella mediterranea]|uniref:Protein ImuA n=1 Tax=Martelella mediterranea DSM 17316 TaxID=1122214 RepID=A0A1U9Z6S7_9HYPH|nr:hypothetical protein [Martelella mediterranea]AQZ53417.1 hypothetical protein Mame_04120 [Martelella mediterranea DSM 17316]